MVDRNKFSVLARSSLSPSLSSVSMLVENFYPLTDHWPVSLTGLAACPSASSSSMPISGKDILPSKIITVNITANAAKIRPIVRIVEVE